MQNDKGKYSNIMKCTILTYKEFGLIGFYRGIFPSALISVNNNAL